MIIECSNCIKTFKIQEDRLPKGKIVTFPCNNCGEKFRLDLRSEQIINEKANGSGPIDTDLAPIFQTGNEADDKRLKARY